MLDGDGVPSTTKLLCNVRTSFFIAGFPGLSNPIFNGSNVYEVQPVVCGYVHEVFKLFHFSSDRRSEGACY